MNTQRRSLRHVTPRYIADRIAVELRELVHPNEPWIAGDAVAFLASWLRPTDVGLECGSGRSTLWLAARTARLVSLEHDARWFDHVRTLLDQTGLGCRVDLSLHPDGMNSGTDSAYVHEVRDLEDASLDYALIDGGPRGHCALAVLPKLRPGSILVVDNINW